MLGLGLTVCLGEFGDFTIGEDLLEIQLKFGYEFGDFRMGKRGGDFCIIMGQEFENFKMGEGGGICQICEGCEGCWFYIGIKMFSLLLNSFSVSHKAKPCIHT